MIDTKFNGSFGLDEIKRISKRYNGITPFYEIRLKNDNRKLYLCDYHSILTEDFIPKRISELTIDDKIWIDISAFSKDKSLY